MRYAGEGYLSESTAACWSPRYASSMTPMVVHARVNRLVMPPVSPAPCTALNTCEQQWHIVTNDSATRHREIETTATHSTHLLMDVIETGE